MSKCEHHWIVTSECPMCLRMQLNQQREAIDVAYDHLLSCGYAPEGVVLQMLAPHTSPNREDALQRRLQQSIEELQRQAQVVERLLQDEPHKPWWKRWLCLK